MHVAVSSLITGTSPPVSSSVDPFPVMLFLRLLQRRSAGCMCCVPVRQHVLMRPRQSYSYVQSTKLYENINTRPKFFIAITGIASLQLLFWVYLSYFALTELHEVDKREKKTGHSGYVIGDNQSLPQTVMSSPKLRIVVSLVSLGTGLFFAMSAYVYPLRVVRSLTLLHSVQSVEIMTHTPLGSIRTFTVPLSDVTCSGSRLTGTRNGMFGMKVRSHALYYLLDHQVLDSSPNGRLFDRIIATRQNVH